jgi:hypothetical protein
MMPQSVHIYVPGVHDADLDIVRREAGVVLASAAPDARCVVEATDGVRRIEFDRTPLRLPRAAWPRESDDLARAIAWLLFWPLVEGQPIMATEAPVACLGGIEATALDWLEPTLGTAVVPTTPRPVPSGVEPGPRLEVAGVVSPVMDEGRRDRRGSHSVRGVLRRLAARLVGEADAVALLARVERHRPRVAAAMRERFSTSLLTSVMRHLVDEGVPLTQPRLICESMLATNCVCPPDLDSFIVFAPPALGVAWSTHPLDDLPPHVWAQCVREGLKGFNASRYSAQQLEFRESWGLQLYAPQWTIEVGLVEPGLEHRIGDGALAASDVDSLLDAIEHEIGTVYGPRGEREIPLLVSASSRHALWHLVRDAMPDLPVLAYQELAPEANIKPLFRISLD